MKKAGEKPNHQKQMILTSDDLATATSTIATLQTALAAQPRDPFQAALYWNETLWPLVRDNRGFVFGLCDASVADMKAKLTAMLSVYDANAFTVDYNIGNLPIFQGLTSRSRSNPARTAMPGTDMGLVATALVHLLQQLIAQSALEAGQ